MMKLEDLLTFYNWTTTHIDMNKCQQLMEEGFLQMKKHVEYPLYLLNYTSKTQYQQQWCKELIHARGLVVAEDGEIIARPLPKFFNLPEITGWGELQEQEYELYKKVDGSLVIMFHYRGKRIFCTRGSFCSDQALKAEEIFNKKYLIQNVMKECTYCFEIIYPENKIIVDYDKIEDLFLISITHVKSGKHVNIDQASFKTVQKIPTAGICHTKWIVDDFENEEGYVMRFISDNLRVKIKFNNYVKKHKGKDITPKQIKDSLKKRKPIDLDFIPDECYEEVKTIIAELEDQFRRKEKDVIEAYREIRSQNTSSRDVIESIKHSQHSKILFAIHANKPYDMLIWKLL